MWKAVKCILKLSALDYKYDKPEGYHNYNKKNQVYQTFYLIWTLQPSLGQQHPPACGSMFPQRGLSPSPTVHTSSNPHSSQGTTSGLSGFVTGHSQRVPES